MREGISARKRRKRKRLSFCRPRIARAGTREAAAAHSQVTAARGQGNVPGPKGIHLSFQINPGKTFWGSLSSDPKVSKTLPWLERVPEKHFKK